MGTCWQYTVKLEARRVAEDRHSSLAASATEITPIPFQIAKNFIERYEWLGTLGAAQRFFGLVAEDELIGVCCFMRTTSQSYFRNVLGPELDVPIYQLCRGASSPHAPVWAGSRLTSGALRLLRETTGAELVTAYADPRAGEIGVVYQAANALYLGMTDSRGPGEYVIEGRKLHPRTVHRIYGSARDEVLKQIDPNYERIQRSSKHRYAFVLNRGSSRRRILERLAPLVRCAPKRSLAD